MNLTTIILELIKEQGILAVIIGVLIETIIVPIPSPIILMSAGAILIYPNNIFTIIFSALLISIIAGLTQTIASLVVYGPGYLIGKPFIDKFERYHGISWKEINDFNKRFENAKSQGIIIFLLRAIPIVPLSVISGVCGIIKIDYKKYLIWTFLGTIPRNFILALSGFYFINTYIELASQFDNIESLITITIILLIILAIVFHKFKIIDKIRSKIAGK